MKVLFKQPRSIDGVDYSKGTHEVPDALESHWFFKAGLLNGALSILEKSGQKVAQPELPKAPEVPAAPAQNYHEHMKQWESKDDKKAAVESDEARLDIKALQKQAKDLGLKAGGKAQEIKARIDQHLGEAKAAQ